MGSRTIVAGYHNTDLESALHSEHTDPSEFETPVVRKRALKGMVTGMVLGAGLWCVILFGFGVIKL